MCVRACVYCLLLQRKSPLNPSSSAIWRRVADRSDEKAVCGVCVCECGNQLTRQDWVNTRAADESEGAVHFTRVCGYNASVSRKVGQLDSMCLQSQQEYMCKL